VRGGGEVIEIIVHLKKKKGNRGTKMHYCQRYDKSVWGGKARSGREGGVAFKGSAGERATGGTEDMAT